MADLRDLTDDELLDGIVYAAYISAANDAAAVLARRLAVLRAERDEAIAERDEAYEDSRLSLDRVNRLVLGRLAAEAERDEQMLAKEECARRAADNADRLRAAEAERNKAVERADENWDSFMGACLKLEVAECERDEAYEDSRRSLDRVNRLNGSAGAVVVSAETVAEIKRLLDEAAWSDKLAWNAYSRVLSLLDTKEEK